MRISGERIAPSATWRAPGDDVVDLDGHVLLPAAVEPHAHLDKAFLAERVPNPTGDLLGAIEAMVAGRHLIDVDDTVERAERAARLMAANGFAAVRTHADTTLDHGLRSVEALVEVRRRVADVIDVEIVAHWRVAGHRRGGRRPAGPAPRRHGSRRRPRRRLPAPRGRRRPAATEVLLQIAADHAVGVDLHTDETLDTSTGLSDLAAVVMATGFAGR